MIKINGINKFYNRKKSNEIHVINNVSLELPEKGLVALLGKSGSGKTTLLNVISGLDKFDSGNIELDAIKIDKYDTKVIDSIRSRKIGYIFQSYYLLEDKSVYENLELSLKLAGLTDVSEIDKRIDYALSLVGMLRYKKRTPNTLSGGQQQRVGIARAIVKGSSIIIADEPTGNLDSDNTFAVMDILKSISKNCLVVLVTHEENIANFFADRIIRLRDGQIIEDYINNSNEDLSLTDSKNLYLKDFKYNNTFTTDNITINYIGDNKSNINLSLIEKDGKFYINTVASTLPVNLIDEKSDIKIINSHYENKNKTVHKSVELDSSILNPIDNDNKNHPISVMSIFKKSWNKYIHTPVRNKIGTHILLFTLAFIIAIVATFITSELFYDEALYTLNTDVVTIHSKSDDTISVVDCIQQGGNQIVFDSDIYFEQLINNTYNFNDFTNYYYSDIDESIIYNDVHTFSETVISGQYTTVSGIGQLTDDYTIIIDKTLAEDIVSAARDVAITDTNFLIGEHIMLNNDVFEIVGIVDAGFIGAFIKDSVYNVYVEQYKDSDKIIELDILTNNKASLKSWCAQQGYNYIDAYESVLTEYQTSQIALLTVTIIVAVIALFIMFFISSHSIKANFINRIKEIGKYRCIGVSKSIIIKEFLFDNILLLCFSSVIGIIFAKICVNLCTEFIRGVYISYYNNSGLIFVTVGLMFFIVYLSLTVIKVAGLLKQTPAEIMSKYDI